MRLPRIGFGSGGAAGWPEYTPEEEAVDTLTYAIAQSRAHGITPWIDSALHYGAGMALERVGMALGENPTPETLLSIKVGRLLGEEGAPDYEPQGFADEPQRPRIFDYSADGVRKAIEQSFVFLNKGREKKGWRQLKPQDLNLIVFVHDPEQGVHADHYAEVLRQVREEALPELGRMKAEGTIKAIGIGTNEAAAALALASCPELDILMVAGRGTLLCHGAPNAPDLLNQDGAAYPALLEAAREHGKQLVIAAPGNSGLLYGMPRYNYAPPSADILAFRDEVANTLQKHGVDMLAAGLQFPLINGARAVISGAQTQKEIDAALNAMDRDIAPEAWKNLADQNLVRAPQPDTVSRVAAAHTPRERTP